MYNGTDLTWIEDIECASNILAIEYLPLEKNYIAISLADRTIIFFDGALFGKDEGSSRGKKKPPTIHKTLHVPST